MKRKEKQELHTKTVTELRTLEKDLRKQIAGLLLEKAQFKLKNTTYIDRVKDKLAVVLTIKNGKETK
jgi:ribosomal protein L29